METRAIVIRCDGFGIASSRELRSARLTDCQRAAASVGERATDNVAETSAGVCSLAAVDWRICGPPSVAQFLEWQCDRTEECSDRCVGLQGRTFYGGPLCGWRSFQDGQFSCCGPAKPGKRPLTPGER